MADSGAYSITGKVPTGCFCEKSSEGIHPTESHLSSEKRVDGTLRESSTRDKENENICKSPTIETLICMGNGVFLVKIRGGKTYALPFAFANKPQIIYSEGFYCIMHETVWYKLEQSCLDYLLLQNTQTKKYIKMYEHSESMHGTRERNKKKRTNSKHASHNECQGSLDSQTIAGSCSVAMEGITNSSVDTAQRDSGGIVTKTDKMAGERTEINRGKTHEKDNEEKPINETEEKSRTGATISSGGNTVKGFKAEIDTNIDQSQTEDPVQRFKREFCREETNNISGDTDKTKEDKSQDSKDEVIQSEGISTSFRLLGETGKTPKKETLVEDFCEMEGIDTVENVGGTGSTSEGNVSNISSSSAAAIETLSETKVADEFKAMPAVSDVSKMLKFGEVQVQAKLGTFENENQNCLLVLWDILCLYQFSDKNRILCSAGSTVTQKWRDHRNARHFHRDVVLVTPGGNLRYIEIIHVASDIHMIRNAAQSGLMKADSEKMKTVVVPITNFDTFLRDAKKLCMEILRAVNKLGTKLKFVESVTLVIQGQHNFPFFSEVFEQESRMYGIEKKTVEQVGGNPERTHSNKSAEEKGNHGEWRCYEGNTRVLKLMIKYLKTHGQKNEADFSKHLVHCSLNFQLMWNFYTQTDCGKKMFDVIAAKHHCKVSLPPDEHLKELFIFQVLDVHFQEESDVKNFVDRILDNVYTCAQESLSIDLIGVDHRIQNDLREKLKERKELAFAWIELTGESDPITVHSVCCKDHQQSVNQIITEVITDTTKSFNNHKEMVMADFMWQRVMTRFEYLNEISLKFPSTEIINDKNLNAFLLKGPRDEVRAVAGHLEELLKIAHKEVHEEVFSPGYQFEIFASSEMCAYIDNSLPKLPVVWIPNHLTKEIHLFSRDPEQLNGIDKCIKGCIEERLYLLLKDNSKLPSEKIHSIEELKKKHKGRIVINLLESPIGLLVTTTDDIFQSVDTTVQKIISSSIGQVPSEMYVPEKPAARAEQSGCQPKISTTNTEIEMKGLKVPITSENVPTPSTETARTYLEMIGDASNTSVKTSEQFKSIAGKETRAGFSDIQSSNILTGSFDPVVYIECKIEVAEDVLNNIKITYGQQGIDSLISDLDQLAKVDIHEGRILVLCDYKYAENVQKCVRNHFNKAKEERKIKIKEENKHLIHGGNENLEWLQFAYGHTSWSKNLQFEGGKLYLTGTLQMKREVEKAVHSMNYWYQEEFRLSSEEQQKADEVVAVVKSELPTIFIKQTKETMIVLSDNRDNFERANFKVKVALGRIKITARGRRHRDPVPYDESYSGLSKDGKMDAEPYWYQTQNLKDQSHCN